MKKEVLTILPAQVLMGTVQVDEAPTLNKVAELRCAQSYEEIEDRNEIEDMRVTVKIVNQSLTLKKCTNCKLDS